MNTDPSDPRAVARRRRLLSAAGLTAAATLWAALQPDDAPVSPTRARAQTPAATAAPTAARGAAASMTRSTAVITWPEPPGVDGRAAWRAALPQGLAAWKPTAPPAPPPAPAPSVAAAVPPQAPAFPYTLIGRVDDGEPRALLSGPLRSFGVKVADVIDGQWRVDAVQAQGVALTWLPGSIKKTIAFTAS